MWIELIYNIRKIKNTRNKNLTNKAGKNNQLEM